MLLSKRFPNRNARWNPPSHTENNTHDTDDNGLTERDQKTRRVRNDGTVVLKNLEKSDDADIEDDTIVEFRKKKNKKSKKQEELENAVNLDDSSDYEYKDFYTEPRQNQNQFEKGYGHPNFMASLSKRSS